MPARNPSELDARLDDYAAHGEAQGAQPRKAWALYTAAAGAALAAAPTAEAAIVYSGLQNLQISATAGYNPGPNFANSYTDFDLDGDLQNDFRLRVGAMRGIEASATYNLAWSARGTDLNNGAFVGGGNNVFPLAYNALVGTPFTSATGVILSQTVGGAPAFGSFTGTNFAGVRFLIGGNTHYGWIQVEVNNTGPAAGFLRIIDWAYESTPDTPVNAGVVPEPSALSLLALGTAGLGLYRRKRTRLAAPEQRETDAA